MKATSLRHFAGALCSIGLLAGLASLPSASYAQTTSGKLKVYFIDVEGGQSTLFVTPTGQSLLIDTGWDGHDGRDADRIVSVAKSANLKRIDYVLITHFHDDHVGGVPQLADRFPIGTFLDHGELRELTDRSTVRVHEEYEKVIASGKYKHLVPKPGDVLPITGMKATVISSDGNLISKPLAGAGQPNEFCKASQVRQPDKTENPRSLGIEIDFGSLKLLDLGDLTWDKEMELMCPDNKLGKMDVLIVPHHGWYMSSSPAMIDAIHPRVAIMDNGEKKGGSVPTLKTLRSAPGLETLWQLHYSAEGEDALNTNEENIANLKGTDPGNFLELTGSKNGSFDVMNSRTKATKHYATPGK